MTNYEKNKEKIDMYVLAGEKWAVDKTSDEVVQCFGFSCKDCLFCNKPGAYCLKRKIKWLKEECIESEVDWSKVPIDTPILVKKNIDGTWIRRYFAGYIGGRVCVFDDSRVSKSYFGITPWNYAKLAESEE